MQLCERWSGALSRKIGFWSGKQRRNRSLLAIMLGLLVWSVRPQALPAALPILSLWACSKLVSSWLNRPPATARNQASPKDVAFLRRTALKTWRYFAEYSTGEHNWLIPEKVRKQLRH